MKKMKVVLYTKVDCGLCVQAKQVLQEVQCEYSFQIEEIDIYEDNDLLEKYHLMIPVVEIGGKQVEYGNIHKGVIINYIKNAVKS
ncbi:Glutaredoxin [Bacillus thuringiensis MC28]|nr:Glutaredoxin [Bacillus thuringiensis MC28]EEL31877.1 Glutaredoxin [Bacillus cereus Rock3-28]